MNGFCVTGTERRRTMFADRAKITIKSGKGGNGCVSFRREPFVPEGGPDGGDGGRGGNIVFLADRNLRTLMDFRYKKKYEAENGQDGMKKKCFGKNGQDLIIKVPVGTVVIDEDTGLVMRDLKEDGESFVAAKGGKGGKGNTNFKNSVRQAPNFAEAGGAAKERNVILELKMIADVGLVGNELPAQIEAIPGMLDRLEKIRGVAAVKVGLLTDYERSAWDCPGLPKMTLVAEPKDYTALDGALVKADEIDLLVRMMSMQKPHPAIAMTGVMCTAAACALEGSIAWQVLRKTADSNCIRMGHAGGIAEGGVSCSMEGGKVKVDSTTGVRTANLLMVGDVVCC